MKIAVALAVLAAALMTGCAPDVGEEDVVAETQEAFVQNWYVQGTDAITYARLWGIYLMPKQFEIVVPAGQGSYVQRPGEPGPTELSPSARIVLATPAYVAAAVNDVLANNQIAAADVGRLSWTGPNDTPTV